MLRCSTWPNKLTDALHDLSGACLCTRAFSRDTGSSLPSCDHLTRGRGACHSRNASTSGWRSHTMPVRIEASRFMKPHDGTMHQLL